MFFRSSSNIGSGGGYFFDFNPQILNLGRKSKISDNILTNIIIYESE